MRIELPTSWKDITVSKWQELYPVLTAEGELIDRVPMLIAVLSGTTLDDVKKTLRLKDYREVSKNLDWLATYTELDYSDQVFFVGKQRYSIDFDFKSEKDVLDKMYGGQYMTYMQILKECDGDLYMVNQNLHRLLACFVCRDKKGLLGWKKGEYDDSIYDEICTDIRNNMSIELAYPISVFFWKRSEELTKSIAEYGSLQLVKSETIIKEVAKDLMKHGDGLQP